MTDSGICLEKILEGVCAEEEDLGGAGLGRGVEVGAAQHSIEVRRTMRKLSVPDRPSNTSARLPPGAHYALTILTALNVINVWHRYLIVSVYLCSESSARFSQFVHHNRQQASGFDPCLNSLSSHSLILLVSK